MDSREYRAQSFMSANDFVEALFQCRDVKVASEPDPCGHIVGCPIGIQTV